MMFILGEIKEQRLDYNKYKAGLDIRRVFHIGKEDMVFIKERIYYPNNKTYKEDCIKRAKLRLGEPNYSAVSNNCECYVNWIFTNDNKSIQIVKSTRKQFMGSVIDGILFPGLLHLLRHSLSGFIQMKRQWKIENLLKWLKKYSRLLLKERHCNQMLLGLVNEFEDGNFCSLKWQSKAIRYSRDCKDIWEKTANHAKEVEHLKPEVVNFSTVLTVVYFVSLLSLIIYKIYKGKFTQKQIGCFISRIALPAIWGIFIQSFDLIKIPVIGDIILGAIGNALGGLLVERDNGDTTWGTSKGGFHGEDLKITIIRMESSDDQDEEMSWSFELFQMLLQNCVQFWAFYSLLTINQKMK